MRNYDEYRTVQTPYTRPIPLPETDPSDTPASTLTLSCEWWAYLLGAVSALRQDGVWDTADPTLASGALAKVENLRELISHASNAGDCATFALSCDYVFTAEQANPWVSVPTPDMLADPAWGNGHYGNLCWYGGYNTLVEPTRSHCTIRADYIPFTLTSFQFVQRDEASADPASVAFQFLDHDLNVLYTALNPQTAIVAYSGPPIEHVCRIIVNVEMFTATIGPTVTGNAEVDEIQLGMLSSLFACEQLVPLADPPGIVDWCYFFDFAADGLGPWEIYGPYGNYVPGVGVHDVAGSSPASTVAVLLNIDTSTLRQVIMHGTRTVPDATAFNGLAYFPSGTGHTETGWNLEIGVVDYTDDSPLSGQTSFYGTLSNASVSGENVITGFTIRGHSLPPYGASTC